MRTGEGEKFQVHKNVFSAIRLRTDEVKLQLYNCMTFISMFLFFRHYFCIWADWNRQDVYHGRGQSSS